MDLIKLFPVIIIMMITACSEKNADKNTDNLLRHNWGEPLREDSSLNFSKADYDYYKKLLIKNYEIADEDSIFDAAHPASIRAQFWVDKIRDIVISDDKLASNIPSPIAVVIDKGVLNANVKAKRVCLNNVTIILNGHLDMEAVNKSSSKSSNHAICENLAATKNQVEVLLRRISNFYDCEKSSISASGSTIDADLYCSKLSEKILIEQPVIKKQLPYITVYNSIFKDAEESVLIGIIAHELAHYYRSHSALDEYSVDYDYFYKVTGYEGDSKPLPLERDSMEAKLAGTYERINKEYLLSPNIEKKEYRNKLAEQLSELNLGKYTAEQEADQIAAEWLHKLHINPKVLSSFFAEKAGGDCDKKFNKGWFIGEELEIEPIGDFSNKHHNLCFRAFSIERDLANHRIIEIQQNYQDLSLVPGYAEMESKSPYMSIFD